MDDFGQELTQRIKRGDETAFKELFFAYYSGLCAMAEQITHSSEQAKDAVQEVFLKIWRQHAAFGIHISLEAYLYRAVRNQALVVLEKQKSQGRIKSGFEKEVLNLFESDQNKCQSQIVKRIWEVVENLPNRRRTAFTLHHRHGLTYKEISTVMEVSLKTVETHIGLALKDIRKRLQRQAIDV
jgi:RNA polymerase sigma-70 factor (ECF subfamily)